MSQKHSLPIKKKVLLLPINLMYQIMRYIDRLFLKIFETVKTKKYILEFVDRPDDIYINSFMRSGTTWMQMILYQLTTDGEMHFESMYDVSPWFERSLQQNESLDHLPSPRFFKTHVKYSLVPKKWQGKFIYVYRNGMDVAVSQYYHYKNVGYPDITFNHSFNNMFLKKNNNSLVSWFKHMADWLVNKKKLDILYIKYEDLSNDLEGSIRKIIKFCDFDVKESQFPRILERCSFKFMKQHEDKFDLLADEKQRQKQMQLNQFFRKGKTKEGEKYFNRNQKKIYLEYFNKYLAKFDLGAYKPRMKEE